MPEDAPTDWQRVSLQDPTEGKQGATEENVYIEVLVRGGREEVGILESIPFERITALLTQIAQSMGSALEKARPNKASAELGLEFGLEEGKLVALIARGTAKANLKIKLEWDRST